MPAPPGGSAYIVADKLRRAVASAQHPGVAAGVTISVGVAEFPANGITRDDIVRAADAALYRAKQSGPNQVCWAPANAGDAFELRIVRPAAESAYAALVRLVEKLIRDESYLAAIYARFGPELEREFGPHLAALRRRASSTRRDASSGSDDEPRYRTLKSRAAFGSA